MTNLFSSLFLGAAAAAVALAAQSTTLCSAGECLTGQSNITRLGAVLTSSSATYLLLPGQYTSSVQPASLAQTLSSATSTISFTNGFSNSTTSTTPSLPLNIALQPGILNYPNDGFSGDPKFYELPQTLNTTNNLPSIERGSILIAANTLAAIEATNNGQKNRVVLWDNVPFVSQLPYSMAGSLQVVSIQSTACSPACSSGGICTTAGTCLCPANFTGQSCEACTEGHFGPQCQACPSGCSKCDEGITGTGACLSTPAPANAPSNCNCANGVCSSGGQCTCSTGWTTGSGQSNTQCNICADGFFQDSSSGNCVACGSGCLKCGTGGTCTQCQPGLTVSGTNSESCVLNAPAQCEAGQFLSGTTCANCDSTCGTCKGATATDCVTCAEGFFFLGNRCVNVQAAALGVCQGSTLVADRVRNVCSTCPVGCTNCQYDTFGIGTLIKDVKCTKCIPGQVLSNGKCVGSCPDGFFVGSDGQTCTACSSSCGTCVGKADFCLTCKNNQLASNGNCVAACASNTFSSGGACVACHPDCATCSGNAFNQCLSCPASLPVLTTGKRCVTNCGKTEYFDSSSGTCKTCDSSCGSCSGGGSSSCLSCANPKQVLRAGSCANVDCGSGSGPTSGLGVCLAELVQVPSGGPPVTIPPLDPNSQQPPPPTQQGLTWWQILLIVLGGVLLLAIILLCWRRHARKKRAQQTEQFKDNLKNQGLWRKLWRNPFAGWWSRRRSMAVSRRSDLERMSDVKDWRSNESSGDRRTAVGVPRSISRGSWITTSQHTNLEPRIHNLAGLGAIREGERYEEDDWKSRSRGEPSYRNEPRAPSVFSDSVSRRYEEPRGESRYYGKEIEQEDSRTEVTYDPYQYPRPDSRGSRSSDTPSMIRSEYTEGDRYDDRQYNHQRGRPREERSYRQDYPSSVTTRTTTTTGSRRHPRDEQRSYRGQRPYREDVRVESPSIYSQPSAHPRMAPAYREPSIHDPALKSRFSMSTTAASAYDRKKRKPAPIQPMPQLSDPTKPPSEAEMYKLSKLGFGDLISWMSPTKKEHAAPPPASRNPFRI